MVPRTALELASKTRTGILVTEHPGRTVLEHLDRVGRARETDERGLTVLDWQYLETLERWGPLGESNITTRLGTVDRDRVLEEVEPFLLRLGLITKGLRGREINPEGRRSLPAQSAPGSAGAIARSISLATLPRISATKGETAFPTCVYRGASLVRLGPPVVYLPLNANQSGKACRRAYSRTVTIGGSA